jgi:glycosyltransferase involved in cell wall biosynthesis
MITALPSPLRICHLIATNFFGGPERQIAQHAHMMLERGHWVRVVSFEEDSRENELITFARSRGIPVLGLPASRPFELKTLWRLASHIRSDQVDLLCTHGYKASVLGRLASWLGGCRHVAVSRGWTGETRRVRLYERLDRMFLRLADAVVAVSEGQRQKVLACGVRPERVRVIHNAIDLNAYPGRAEKSIRAELGIPAGSVLVVTAGRLSPEKNHLGLVMAARQVLARRDDVHFVVCGEGFLREELEKAVCEAGIGHRFLLPGFRSDVRSFLHECDIFVLPSHTEGLPNAVLEAFACSKPVVATEVGGMPELVRDGLNGLLVPACDMNGLARCIQVLAEDKDLRGRMGQEGFRIVKEYYNYDTQAESYLELYCNIKNMSYINNLIF